MPHPPGYLAPVGPPRRRQSPQEIIRLPLNAESIWESRKDPTRLVLVRHVLRDRVILLHLATGRTSAILLENFYDDYRLQGCPDPRLDKTKAGQQVPSPPEWSEGS